MAVVGEYVVYNNSTGQKPTSYDRKSITCFSDISNNVKTLLVNKAGQGERNDGPTALLVKHRDDQAPQ